MRRCQKQFTLAKAHVMEIEDPDLTDRDLIIHEVVDDENRYLHSFFTTDGSSMFRHKFSLIGLYNTEAMTISSEELAPGTYPSIAASDRGHRINISSYSGNPIRKAIVSVDHIFEGDRTYQDIVQVALHLKDGRKLVFCADSPPPFVPFMSISETAPIEKRPERA